MFQNNLWPGCEESLLILMLSPWFFNLVRKILQTGCEQTVPVWLTGQRDLELGKYRK